MIPSFHVPTGQAVVLHLLSATALLAVLAMADAVLRRRGRHRVRATLATAAVLKLAAGPWLCFTAVDGPATAIVVTTGEWLGESARPEAATAAFPWVWLWLCGALVAGSASVLRTLQMKRRLEASARAAGAAVVECAEQVARRLGLDRTPAVRLTDDPAAPCVVGVRRPVIYLPSQDGPAAIPIDHALLHEFAHIRRRDLPLGFLLRVLAIAYWFHPLVWHFCRRIAELREIGCDADAARAAADGPVAYRNALLRSAAVRFGLVRPTAVLGWIGPSAGILIRLRQLDRTRERADDGALNALWPLGSAGHARNVATLLTGVLLFTAAPVFVTGTAEAVAAAPAVTAQNDDVVPLPQDDDLAAARGIWERQAAGGRESCLNVRFAAIRLAAAASNMEAETAAASKENRR